MNKLFKKEIDCISAGITLGKNNSGDNHPKLMIARSSIGINDALKQRIIEKQAIKQPWGHIKEEILKKELKFYYENKRKYKLENGILYIRKQDKNDNIVKYWRIVVPNDREIRNRILEEIHSAPYAGHPGFNKTMEKINRHFYWESISLDVRNFIVSCPVCQMEKSDHRHPYGELQPLRIPEEKWADVMIDFVTKLLVTRRGHDSILTIVDRATMQSVQQKAAPYL